MSHFASFLWGAANRTGIFIIKTGCSENPINIVQQRGQDTSTSIYIRHKNMKLALLPTWTVIRHIFWLLFCLKLARSSTRQTKLEEIKIDQGFNFFLRKWWIVVECFNWVHKLSISLTIWWRNWNTEVLVSNQTRNLISTVFKWHVLSRVEWLLNGFKLKNFDGYKLIVQWFTWCDSYFHFFFSPFDDTFTTEPWYYCTTWWF